MEKTTQINGYAISSEIKKCLKEEGYVILRLVENKKGQSLKMCETVKIETGETMPEGTDTIIAESKVNRYARLILIETDF